MPLSTPIGTRGTGNGNGDVTVVVSLRGEGQQKQYLLLPEYLVAVDQPSGSCYVISARAVEHATSRLKEHNPEKPSRISLVFSAHEHLDQPNHGRPGNEEVKKAMIATEELNRAIHFGKWQGAMEAIQAHGRHTKSLIQHEERRPAETTAMC